MDRTVTVEAHYPRRATEGAEHQGDAAVSPEVGYRLHAAAGQVEPRDAVLADDPEAIETPRRDVDVRPRVRGSRGDEEDRLRMDPGYELIRYVLEGLRHAVSRPYISCPTWGSTLRFDSGGA